MSSERMRQFNARLRPLNWAGFIVSLGLIAALASGSGRVPNPWALLCVVLVAVINAVRNVKMYALMDEYERSLMLRALAVAFIFLMAGVFITAMVGTLSPLTPVSPLLLMGLFLASWLVFGAAHHVMQRREASE